MTLHLAAVRLIGPVALQDDPGSPTLADGLIPAVNEPPPAGATIIDDRGLCLAPGLIDWGVKIGEPAERHRKSLRSAWESATADCRARACTHRLRNRCVQARTLPVHTPFPPHESHRALRPSHPSGLPPPGTRRRTMPRGSTRMTATMTAPWAATPPAWPLDAGERVLCRPAPLPPCT